MRVNKNGQSLVEFTMVVPLLLLFLFGIVDLGAMFYVNLTMQYAVREGARYAVTGQSGGDSTRKAAVINKIKNCSNGLYDRNLNVQKEPQFSVIDPSRVTFDNYSGTPQNGDPGNSGDVTVVSLTYIWPLLTPILKPFFPNGYKFTVKSTMRNENF